MHAVQHIHTPPIECAPLSPHLSKRHNQEFLRAFLHLTPPIVYLGGESDIVSNLSTVFDASHGHPSETDADRPSTVCETNPKSYFDGMPGRTLGGGEKTQQHPGPFSDRGIRSPSRGKYRTKNAAAKTPPHHEMPFGGLAAAAASLRLARDGREERRAWAQRAGIGRTMASSINDGIPKCWTQASAAEVAVADGKNVGIGTTGKYGGNAQRRAHRIRARSMDTKAITTGQSEMKNDDDDVSQAFARYTSDRDRDRDNKKRSLHRTPIAVAIAKSRNIKASSSSSPLRRHRYHGDPLSSISPPTLRPYGESSQEGSQYSQRQKQGLLWGDKNRADMLTDEEDNDLGSSPTDDDLLARHPQESHRSHDRRVFPRRFSTKKGRSGAEGGGHVRPFGSTPRREPNINERGRGRSQESRYASARQVSDKEAERGAGGEGQMSESERQRALKQAFDIYDQNGDGFITYLEVIFRY